MADPATPAPAPAIPQAGHAAPTPAPKPSETAAPAPVSREEFDKALETINFLAASYRRQQEAPRADPQTPAAGKKPGSDPVDELRAKIEAQENRLATRAREVEVRSAIAAHGLDAEGADLVFSAVMHKHAGEIKFDPDKGEVFVEDPVGRRLPVKGLVDAVLGGPIGERFKPAKRLPGARGLQGAAAAPSDPVPYAQIPEEERLKMTPEQRAAALAATFKR